MYECKFEMVNGIKAFRAEFDGAVKGTRSMQYQIPKPSGGVLVITATCKNSTVPRIRNEFEGIMDSFQLKK